MRGFFLFVPAFAVLTGMALLFAKSFQIALGEGMMPAVTAVVGLMYAGGMLHQVNAAVTVIVVMGCAGFVVTAVGRLVKRNRSGRMNGRPYIGILWALFFLTVLLYYHDFIQHIDEFHQWAAAVKYILEKNALPVYPDFIGGTGQLIGTSLFIAFFQKLTGYNEGFMYVTATMLCWIGLLLPFARDNGKQWKKMSMYSLLVFIAVYSLYFYGMKNLYVDMAVASWAGGLAGWWQRCERKKSDWFVAACGLSMVYFFKLYVGLLLVLLLLVFMAMEQWLRERKKNTETGQKIFRKQVLVTGAATLLLLFSFAVARFGFGFISFFITNARTVKIYLKDILISFITRTVGVPLNPRSGLRMSLSLLLVLVMGIHKIAGSLSEEQERKKTVFYIGYSIGAASVYLLALLTAYLFLFQPSESTGTVGLQRYLTGIGLFLFIPALIRLFTGEDSDEKMASLRLFSVISLFVLFSMGINQDFVTQMTAFNKESVPGYTDIQTTKEDITKISNVITADDRVFLINQNPKQEYTTNVALYYLEEQVNNYLNLPWRFTEKGSVIRVDEYEEPGIDDLPILLAEGHYSYVWVYAEDDYLKNSLASYIENGEVTRALYAVRENKDGSFLLEMVIKL